MASTNEITGDKLQSKVGNKQAYDDGYDRIFSKEAKAKLKTVEEKPIEIHTIYKPGPCQLHGDT